MPTERDQPESVDNLSVEGARQYLARFLGRQELDEHEEIYGGTHHLKATQVVDLETLDYSRLENGEAFILELVTPFVLKSEYPNAHDRDVLWWWDGDHVALRQREEKMLEQGDVYRLQTVDHGQVAVYEGDRPVEPVKSGISRIGTHSKYGFGELRVKPVEPRSDGGQISVEETAITG